METYEKKTLLTKHDIVMKKNTINLIVGAILIVAMIALGAYLFTSNRSAKTEVCPEPDKPENVPAEALWVGGCAGGDWIYMVSDSSNHYRFQVYNKWRGRLAMDCYFTPDTIGDIGLTKANWKEQDLFYQESMDSLVYISMVKDEQTIMLRSVYPAFGGSRWDELKNEYQMPETRE